jgi:hypothetical protein
MRYGPQAYSYAGARPQHYVDPDGRFFFAPALIPLVGGSAVISGGFGAGAVGGGIGAGAAAGAVGGGFGLGALCWFSGVCNPQEPDGGGDVDAPAPGEPLMPPDDAMCSEPPEQDPTPDPDDVPTNPNLPDQSAYWECIHNFLEQGYSFEDADLLCSFLKNQ